MSKKNQVAVEESNEVKTEVSKVEQYSKVGLDKLVADHKSISGAIRFLESEGLTRGEIAKVTGKRYQHVRNVLVTPLTAKKDA